MVWKKSKVEKVEPQATPSSILEQQNSNSIPSVRWSLVNVPTEHELRFRDEVTGDTYTMHEAICELLNRTETE